MPTNARRDTRQLKAFKSDMQAVVRRIAPQPPFDATPLKRAEVLWKQTARARRPLLFLQRAMRGTLIGVYARRYYIEIITVAGEWLGTDPESLREMLAQMEEGLCRRIAEEVGPPCPQFIVATSSSEDERDSEVEADESGVEFKYKVSEVYHAGETTTDPEDYASSADEDTIVVSVMENEGGNVTIELPSGSERINNGRLSSSYENAGSADSQLEGISRELAQTAIETDEDMNEDTDVEGTGADANAE